MNSILNTDHAHFFKSVLPFNTECNTSQHILTHLLSGEFHKISNTEHYYLLNHNLKPIYDYIIGKISFADCKYRVDFLLSNERDTERLMREISAMINQENHQTLQTQQDVYSKAAHKGPYQQRQVDSTSSSSLSQADTNALNKISDQLGKNQRLSIEQAMWLLKHCFSPNATQYSHQIKRQYHEVEAAYFKNEYLTTGNAWNILNASSHLRKADKHEEAHNYLVSNNITKQNEQDKRLLSAYITCLGASKRDLSQLDEAIKLGIQAHNLNPSHYKPCTLLGACYIQTQDYEIGHKWYSKAVELGAEPYIIDADLKSLLKRTHGDQRKSLIVYFLDKGPNFTWMRKYL
jgi:tetratricopeptide (TPR) repeat protein